MMRKVIEMDGADLRAHKEFSMHLPLDNDEYKRLRERIPYVLLSGERFDDMNTIYPMRIPAHPVSYSINKSGTAFSLLLRVQNRSVSVIGDNEMRELYMANGGQYIYGVGRLMETNKSGKLYINMKLRGWLLVKLKEKKSVTSSVSVKKK